MWLKHAVERVGRSRLLDALGERGQRFISEAYERLPLTTRVQVGDTLRGKHLGHPLHPVLTDVVIGTLVSSAALDALESVGVSRAGPGADGTLMLALAMTVPTAAAGATDWQRAAGPARPIGLMHAALNVATTLLGFLSLTLRLARRRRAARLWSVAGLGLVMVSAYLGGDLVFQQGMGVDPIERKDS